MSKITKISFAQPFMPPSHYYEFVLKFEVLGEPGRKSNQRRIVRGKNGAPMIIKSEKAMNYQTKFLAQVPAEYKLGLGSKEEPLALRVVTWYKSNRPDISTELIQDLLEKAGVVSNDRWFKAVFCFGNIDSENPRSEIEIYKIH